ncbi:hypothetical protein ZYGR_0AI01260 [Zygosaccharomyces rouxii]|uniref:prephenate dehydratase n=1 Tax=Zygosaccharomyces rouxii TaxID=4956 RepID=A0A1Q3AAR7_ZYGRO|nr:hypothetical protein ZYGR_0AI01260 [Zygosaccharomyces rouxii]
MSLQRLTRGLGWKMVKALYLGPPGTYSHQAALQQFDYSNDVDYIPTSSIPECIQKLETDKSIDYSVIPLENSTNGQVVFSYDLLRDRMVHEEGINRRGNQVIPTLEIVGEQYVSIAHCLIATGPKPALGDFSRVKIYSHPQVWGQVSDYLQSLQSKFPDTAFEKIDSSSTSEAVRRILRCESQPGVIDVAIAGEVAAKLNQCSVVDTGINDVKGNTTRFLILQRRNHRQVESRSPKVSLMTFTTKQDDPGSLVDVLTILKTHGVNMCSINSRPYNRGKQKWQYVFFIEYYYQKEGHDWDVFYQELENLCSEWCLWGIFPRNANYYA